MTKDRLLKLIGAFIKASDSELVDKRSCFPCPQDQHEFYKVVRDCYQTIYTESDYTQSISFENEIEGKSQQLKLMKSKIYGEPTKRTAHRNKVIDMLCNLSNIDEAKYMINKQYLELYEIAVDNLSRCYDK